VNRWAAGVVPFTTTERRLGMTITSRVLTGVVGLSMLVAVNGCGTATGAAVGAGAGAAVGAGTGYGGGRRDLRHHEALAHEEGVNA
jgi:hypothetical protein